jgi:hypothetical protein
MRKRHAARPMLESVEDRMVPSALGALDPTAGIRAAISTLENHHARATPAVATHHATPAATHQATARATRAAARAARHQAALAAHHTAAQHTTHHSSSSSSSSLSTAFSNFFKSLGF